VVADAEALNAVFKSCSCCVHAVFMSASPDFTAEPHDDRDVREGVCFALAVRQGLAAQSRRGAVVVLAKSMLRRGAAMPLLQLC